MISVDLHLHTRFSDGKLPINKLVDLCGQAGLDAIAITDHLCTRSHLLGKSARFLNITLTEENWSEYVAAIEKEKNRAWKEYRMLVLAGVEYTHNTFDHDRNAHILAVDIKEFVSPELSEEEWMKAVRQQGCLVVAAHPMKLQDASSQTYHLLHNAERFAPLIDVWEAANARTLWREMLRKDFSLIASSDLHAPGRWPGWRTQIYCEKDPDAIKAHFKNKDNSRDFIFMTGNTSELKHRVRLRAGEKPHFMKKGHYDPDSPFPLDNVGLLPSYV